MTLRRNNDVVIFGLLPAFAMASFFLIERKHPSPRLKVYEIVNQRYLFGIALYCFRYLILGANNYVLPNFLQSRLGYSWETVVHYQSLGLLRKLVAWLIMAHDPAQRPSTEEIFHRRFSFADCLRLLAVHHHAQRRNVREHTAGAILQPLLRDAPAGYRGDSNIQRHWPRRCVVHQCSADQENGWTDHYRNRNGAGEYMHSAASPHRIALPHGRIEHNLRNRWWGSSSSALRARTRHQ